MVLTTFPFSVSLRIVPAFHPFSSVQLIEKLLEEGSTDEIPSTIGIPGNFVVSRVVVVVVVVVVVAPVSVVTSQVVFQRLPTPGAYSDQKLH